MRLIMTDEDYMEIALNEAKKCNEFGDVPVGAIIVMNGEIVARAYNQKEKDCATCHHAEILCIGRANEKLKSNRLDNAIIYTTKEPCLMCMGAILSARISKIVYGASDLRFGTKDLAKNNNFNHKCDIEGGILEEKCSKYLSEFFKQLR